MNIGLYHRTIFLNIPITMTLITILKDKDKSYYIINLSSLYNRQLGGSSYTPPMEARCQTNRSPRPGVC